MLVVSSSHSRDSEVHSMLRSGEFYATNKWEGLIRLRRMVRLPRRVWTNNMIQPFQYIGHWYGYWILMLFSIKIIKIQCRCRLQAPQLSYWANPWKDTSTEPNGQKMDQHGQVGQYRQHLLKSIPHPIKIQQVWTRESLQLSPDQQITLFQTAEPLHRVSEVGNALSKVLGKLQVFEFLDT